MFEESKISRRQLMAGAAASALLPGVVRAQAFPNRPITIVVPYPPGASTDQVARLVQQRMTTDVGVPVIVDNRGGANGNVGAAYVAKSPPDGYRILLATQPIVTINPYVYKSVGFDPNKELTPLTCAVNGVVSVAVHPSLPVNNIAELIAYGKARPGELNYGTAGAGSPQHIGGLLFAQRAGFEWTHVPYRGGGPMVADLMSGQIKCGIVTLSSVKALADQGKLKILAIGEKTRFSGAPNIPTISESLAGFDLTTWLGFFGPGGLPPELTQFLSRHLVAALTSEGVRSKLQELALPVRADGPAALAQLVAADQALYQRIIRERNITAE
jgi:tripartite-type tricarboxylate transporter receptor subunit TctC